MRRPCIYIIYSFAVAITLAGCGNKDALTGKGAPGESYPTLTSNGAWCWFSDPRAMFYEGEHKRTYAGWVDSLGNIVVGSYDHETGNIETKILREHFQRDDHDNPSFLIDRDRRMMVFYSKHAGRSPIYLEHAANPEDISEWRETRELRLNDSITYVGLSNTYTYANIVRLSEENDRLYLFWRGADFKPNFSTSSDFGEHWTTGKILVLPDRIYRDRRPYMKVASNGRDVIHIAFTDGHPNAEPTNSIYYMKYQNGSLYKASGEKIADWEKAPVNPQQADLVYDAKKTKEKAWVWDVAETRKGQPVIVYARFASDSNHVYYYSIYADGRWNNYRLVDSGRWFPETLPGRKQSEPNYSGGIVLDHNDPAQIYLSREKNGVFEIEKWATSDEGKTWDVTEITKGSKHDNVRPFVIYYHKRKGPVVLWMNLEKYVHYTNFRSSIRMDTVR